MSVTPPDSLGDFSKFALPLIRSVYPKLIFQGNAPHYPPSPEIFEESIKDICSKLSCYVKCKVDAIGASLIFDGVKNTIYITADKEGIYNVNNKKFIPQDPAFITDIVDYLTSIYKGKIETMGDSLLAVQPMSSPTTSIFYLDFNKKDKK